MSTITRAAVVTGDAAPPALRLAEKGVWTELAFLGDGEQVNLRSLGRLMEAFELVTTLRGALARGGHDVPLGEGQATTLRWLLAERRDYLRETRDDPAESPRDREEADRELRDLDALGAGLEATG